MLFKIGILAPPGFLVSVAHWTVVAMKEVDFAAGTFPCICFPHGLRVITICRVGRHGRRIEYVAER